MEWLLRVLSGLGLALAAYRAWSVARLAVDDDAFVTSVVKLCRAGNVQRARKLATAFGAAALPDMVRAAFDRAASLAASDDEDAVRADLQSAFDARYRAHAATLATGRLVSLFALALLLGALALPLARGAAIPFEVVVAGLVGVAALAWSAWRAAAILARSNAGFARLLPVLVDAVRAGDDRDDEDPTATARPPAESQAPPGPGQRPILYLDVYRADDLVRSETLAASVIKVGSDAKSHLRLDGPRVARMHAVIEVDAAASVLLLDLGAPDGTRVNGAKVAKARLAHGDSFTIGDLRVVVGIDRPPPQDD